MESQKDHPDAYPQSTDAAINDIAYTTGLFQGVIGDGQQFQADKNDADANARDGAWKEHASLWGGSLVGSTVSVATASFTGPAGVYAGGLVGTAAGEIFNGILDGFDGDGSEEKEQVYKNVGRADQVEHSAILTTQESVKSAHG